MADTTLDESKTAGRCKLLTIPSELRNRIYDEVFKDSTVTLDSNYQLHALLRTCKTINNEATQLYHANTTFTCKYAGPRTLFDTAAPAITQWIKKLPARSRNSIQAIRYDNPELVRSLDWEAAQREGELGSQKDIRGLRYSLCRFGREAAWDLRGLKLSQIVVPWMGVEENAWEWKVLSEIVDSTETELGRVRWYGRY